MSVLKNKRSESQLEFYHTATLIRAELTRFVMNDKVVPKRWRRLKKFAKMVEAGEMTIEDAKTAYGSWKGYALRRGGKLIVRRMDRLFRKLFGVDPPKCKLQ